MCESVCVVLVSVCVSECVSVLVSECVFILHADHRPSNWLTRFLDDGFTLLLPLVVDPCSCHLTEELQSLGVRGQSQLVYLFRW